MVALVVVNPLVSYATGTTIPTDKIFESLYDTKKNISDTGVLTINKGYGALGQVSSTGVGFQALIPNPGSAEGVVEGGYYYLGLYNTGVVYHSGGYGLWLESVSKDTVRWGLIIGTTSMSKATDTVVGSTVSGITGDKILLRAWLNGIDGTTGNPRLNVMLGDTQIIKNLTLAGSTVEIGKYMTVCNSLCDSFNIEASSPKRTDNVVVGDVVVTQLPIEEPDEEEPETEEPESEEPESEEPKQEDSGQDNSGSTVEEKDEEDKQDSSTQSDDSAPVVTAVLIPVAVLIIAAGAVTGVVLFKKKKKRA